MRKLIYFSDLPLTEPVEHHIFLDHLRSGGFDIEYWDHSAACGVKPDFPGVIQRPYVRKFSSTAELVARADKEARNGAIFLSLTSAPERFLGFLRILKKHNAPLFRFGICQVPLPATDLGKKIMANWRGLFVPKRLSIMAQNRLIALAKRLGIIKDYDIVFAAGQETARMYAPARIVPINQNYYDEYLAACPDPPKLVPGRYGVFLDDNLPYHYDWAYHGIKTIPAEPYYKSLNAFFSRLEQRYGLKIAIAAHPKSDYRTNPFEGRTILKGKTALLTFHAEFAITTISSSVGNAVLHRKPIVFIYTPEIIDRYAPLKIGPLQETSAEFLGCPRLNIDDERERSEFTFKPIDERRYDAYKYGFILSPESENRLTTDIFKDFIKNYRPLLAARVPA